MQKFTMPISHSGSPLKSKGAKVSTRTTFTCEACVSFLITWPAGRLVLYDKNA